MKAKEFDRLFDEGKDLTEYLDFDKARRPNRERRAGAGSPAWRFHTVIASSVIVALGAFAFVLWR